MEQQDNSLKALNTRTGNRWLAWIVLIGQSMDISHLSLPERRAKKEDDWPWFATGIYQQGERLLKEKCQGARGIVLDLDGTTLTDSQIAKLLRNWEYLQHTSATNDPTKPTRKLHIIIPYDRNVSMAEHKRIKIWFEDQLRQIEPNETNLALDTGKMDPYSKIYIPTATDDAIWARVRNKNKLKPLNVEYVLARQPRLPIIMPPTEDDIDWHYGSELEEQAYYINREQRLIDKAITIINTMAPHDRSNKACQVGGIMCRIDRNHHEQLYTLMRQRGVGQAALKSAQTYANKRR